MADQEFLAHYSIDRREDGTLFELGRGAMGITYKAFDTKLHCPVALKVINSQILNNKSVRQRFLREARSAAGLRHKNVASVFHLGDEGETYFYAMEYIDGETIASLVNRIGRIDPATALDITLQVVSALVAAHRRNLIHRDIKPANLMLVQEDEEEILVKVIDFGLAKSLENAGTAITLGGFVGTPDFSSPEQLEERPLDARSDIYSLGATLWYMLAGRPIFTGGMLQVMSQHLTKPPPMEHLADLPAPLCAVLERMLAKDPADRPQTPLLLRHELTACRRLFAPDVAGVTGEGGGLASVLLHGDPTPLRVSTPGTDGTGAAMPGTDSGLPMTGTLIAGRYRLDKYCGGNLTEPFFQTRDLQSNQDVALKVLPPAVSASAEWNLLEEAVKRIQAAPHPTLRKILTLERFASYGILVSEWITGFPLIKTLAARGALGLPEVLNLLEPMVQAVDHARAHGLDQLDLCVQRVFVQLPDGGDEQKSAAWMHQSIEHWPPFAVKVTPLTLGFVVDNETMGAVPERTIMADLLSAARVGSGEASARDELFALAHVTYELLGGRPFLESGLPANDSRGPGKLSMLSERQNALLHGILVSDQGSDFDSARAFYDAFRGDSVPARPGTSAAAAVTFAPVTHAATRSGGAEALSVVGDQTLLDTMVEDGSDTAAFDARSARARRRWALAAVVLAVLIGGGWLAWQNSHPALHPATAQSAPTHPSAGTPTPVTPAAGQTLDKEQQLMALLGTGRDFENAGNDAGAIRSYAHALQTFSDYEEPMQRMNKVLDDVQGQIADDATFKSLRAPITEAANAGSALAMMMLGGALVKMEPTEALRWYKLAADHDRRDAMTQIGKMYWAGMGAGTGPDYAQAASWFEKASLRGDPEAKYQLAILYAEGHGLKGDVHRSVDLLRDLASAHDARALNLLGEYYRGGKGVPKSFKQAADYFDEARKAGNLDASANLGVAYINGQGVDKNPRYGMDLIRQSAEGNNPLAMYYYAVCFESGIGQANNSPNLDQAKVWYIKAARARYQLAIEWCDKNNVAY